MLTSHYYLQDCLSRLKNLDKLIKENTDIEPFKTRLYTILYDMASAAEECYFMFKHSEYNALKECILRAVGTARDTTEGLVFKQAIQSIVDRFPEPYDFRTATVGNYNQRAYDAHMKYTPLTGYNMNRLAEIFTNASNRIVNILDPRCRDGQNLQAIKNNIPNTVAYGIEQEEHIANTARTRLDRIAKGTLKGSKISNEVFDIMFLEPAISWTFTTMNGSFYKQEKALLQDTIKYLRPRGTLIFVVPYFKLYRDMCLQISKYLDNVQVRKLHGSDFDEKGLVVIVGQKSIEKEADETSYRLLRELYNIDRTPSIANEPLQYVTLPDTAETIEFFRGSILDMDEMENITLNSGCLDAFWKAQTVEKLSENIKQPLLPFNIGQIGLVLTSGCLDGIVDEGNGNYHVIKGRVSKLSQKETDILDDSMEVNETISNRVEINVIMPNGEYKVLA